ncbi:hypothetical protein [Nitrosomonas sp.]|uniref:hypothetical protein n=1 Tax=Nitrosomonas sp. TaxID=42353 RepID=UPI001DE17BD7|nr:hypothetical protein [Nitrosomonas sp.]MBX3617851.1 hypothetical protein [Nitrosomonas sp.]
MTNFKDTQDQIDSARRQHQQNRLNWFAANEKLQKNERTIASLSRRTDIQAKEQLQALLREQESLRANTAKLQTELQQSRQVLLDHELLFEVFSDPTKNIEQLNDLHPILLFPLRIETRFKKVAGPDGRDDTVNHLWVRVYPDDISIDTFEEIPSEVEISNTRVYWTNIWKAGGIDSEKRAAWQSLVKSHGAGRAYWLSQLFKPLNLTEEPVKAEGDYLLVIVSEQALPAAEKPFVQQYWQAVFNANNDPTALDAAYTALKNNLGEARTQEIVTSYQPQNLNVKPAQPETATNVRVEFLELPVLSGVDTQLQAWSNPARVALLPERFVVMGFNGTEQTLLHIGRPVPSELIVGPNPNAPEDQQLRLENDELIVPDEMKWVTDFDEAVAKGMGFKINLTDIQARRGFDRLFVLGVRLSADVNKSRDQLQQLIQHHQRSRKGFSLLPQGTPTNNVEDQESGYSWFSDADASYDHYFTQYATDGSDDDPSDWRTRKDGRWLASSLGIDPAIMKLSPQYYANDQLETRAMNEALWPATLGYFMDQMMEPVFSDDTITSTRNYFNRYVLGRGTLPAIRIGKQPYGILPATPFSRMAWINRKIFANDRLEPQISGSFLFLSRLYALIKKVDERWVTLLPKVSYVGKPQTDPQQALLDIVGLHPASVEFYQRYAESAEQLYNRYKTSGINGAIYAAIASLIYTQSGLNLLAQLGYSAQENNKIPDILNKFFTLAANLLKGPLIDDQALSEFNPIRPYHTDGSNYLQWLAAAARDSHNTLRLQQGFIDDKPPTALLYLMLHHALDLSYLDTSLRLHLEANVLNPQQFAVAKREPKFLHIQEIEEDKGSPWQYLYKTEPAITNQPNLQIADFIPQILTLRNPYLNTQINAVERLRQTPTARLERSFAEHIDCCSYRLDAWWLGLLNVQLDIMQQITTPAQPLPGTVPDNVNANDSHGCYLGAYAWLEDVRPENKNLVPVELTGELDKIFNKPGQAPLVTDDKNFGYIHAPSLNHAVTAAVLRNGYLANATPSNPDSLAVNLTSERVRLAMNVIDGMRNGQSLSSLLGYYLERGLHDAGDLFLDSIIFDLRKQFPLAGDRLSTTKSASDAPISAVEARNVVDGLALIEHVQAQTGVNRNYPFGIAALPTITEQNKLDAINREVQHIMNINDAVADLAMAEGVYQVVRGNYERAAGTLDAFSKGHFPPVPEVVQTPRSGVTLTHRVGLHLRAGLNPGDPANSTPRAKAEPAVNQWLTQLLPVMSDIFCTVDYYHHGNAQQEQQTVSAQDLGLLAIDLVYMLSSDQQQMTALDDRILTYVYAIPGVRVDSDIKIQYRGKLPGKFSLFEVMPMLHDLKALITQSRPLKTTDVKLPNEASQEEDSAATIRAEKVTAVRDLLLPQQTALNALKTQIDTWLNDADPAVAESNALNHLDEMINGYLPIAHAVNQFGLTGAATGFVYDWRRVQFLALLEKLQDIVTRWQASLQEFEQRITDFGALDPSTPVENKMQYLMEAALLITTESIPIPASNDPDDLLTALNTTHKTSFQSSLSILENLLATAGQVGALYASMFARESDIALHDTQPLDIADNKKAIISFAQSLQAKAQDLATDIDKRLTAANALITGDASTSAEKRIEELTQAIRQLTHEDFVILPEFNLTAAHGGEWQQSYDNRAQLLNYQKNDLGVDFPEDNWLYGVARVREKLQRWESVMQFGEALNNSGLNLTPLQFPYRTDDHWLALQYPDTQPGTSELFVIDSDKLLYTAHYVDAFAQNAAICGLLLDEWTEVIPTTQETTGLTFHYDRPNCEAPQSLLLALPANFTGHWQWQDLVDTLHETLDMAGKRAVEPAHWNETEYARFLPAVISSVTRYPIMMTLDFAFNNAVQFKSNIES